MNVARFLTELRTRQIEVRAEGNTLRVSAPRGAIDDELARQILGAKPEILSFLRMGQSASPHHQRRRVRPTSSPKGDGDIIEAPMSFGQRRLFYIDQLAPSSLWLKGRKGSTRLIPRTTLPHGHEST